MNFEIIKRENFPIDKQPPAVHHPAGEFVEISRPIDFRAVLQLLVEKWLVILIVSLASAGVAAVFVFCAPAKYQAKAVLQVEQEEPRVLGSESVTSQDLKSPEALNTIVQTVKNSRVLRRVVRTNDLAANPNFLPKSSTKPVSETKLINALGRMITVKLRPETRLIDISVLHRDSETAEKLANSVAQEFVRENLYARFNTSKAANGLLYEEAARLKAKLENSEREIQAYKEATQTVSIEDRQNVIVEKLKELSKRYTDAQSQRLALEAELAQLDTTSTNPAAILAMPSVQADPAVAELRRKLLEQEANLAALSAQYQPTFPKVQQAKEQIQQLERIVQSFAEKVRLSVQSSHAAASAREKNIESALKKAEAEALEVDKKGVGYNVRLRELQSDRALYDSVLKRLKETDLSKGLGQASLTLVEPANGAVEQDLPAMLIIGGCLFLGFAGSLGFFYLLRRAKGSIHTVDDAEHLLGLPVWAAIPSSRNDTASRLSHIMAEEPGSLCAESFRTLRTSATVTGPNSEKKIMLFTSADPGEGKTFCSLNYAVCQAQEGKRTLLIDLDLRKPSIGGNFDLPPETAGVTDYMVQRVPLLPLLRSTPYQNLYVLPAGSRIANPAEELAKTSILDLLSEASGQFDRIVIDTAPINAVSDTFLILPFADTVCLVVKSGRTSQRAAKRAMELMARANIAPAGVVLNYLPQHGGYGAYYHYGAKYGDGVYGSTAEPKALLNS